MVVRLYPFYWTPIRNFVIMDEYEILMNSTYIDGGGGIVDKSGGGIL